MKNQNTDHHSFMNLRKHVDKTDNEEDKGNKGRGNAGRTQ